MPKTLPLLEDTSPICCAPLGSREPIDAHDATTLAIRLKALADPARLQMLGFLLGLPGQEASTSELARLVGLSDPTASHHLKTLEAAGLLTKERRGMSVYHRVVPEAIHAIAKALHINVCC
ncbi:MAG TPA: metalloregulator ArsR/SmtB family transcription factor [Propionibacteriaceae bacterium]|nr:metalloregulator ArsR/SmtB family transcription factor [Propionibacteriaceae bacterium]